MRDIAITLIVAFGCLYTLKRPYIGILLWSWLSYMNPHRLAYGFAYSMPFAQVTAVVLLCAMLFSKEVRSPPKSGIIFIWIFFIIWMGLTSVTAYYTEFAYPQFIKVLKIQFIVFLTMMLITDLNKLNKLIWVIVLSIGYFSVKGGVFTLLTGGGYRVYGPSSSFIFENNALAVAVLMIIPFMIYLYQVSTHRLVRNGLIFSIVMSLFTVLGSQSRGALIALGTVGLFFWIKSKNKFNVSIIILASSIMLLAFMPDSWYARMNTIETYDQDTSAMGRLNAWQYAINVANDNFIGMGFASWSPETFAIYAPNPLDWHAAHSIYFSVLADHGWVGLAFFLSIMFSSWKELGKLIKDTDGVPGEQDIFFLAKMLQISFIAYFSGGAFLSLSYFDLPWHMVAFVLILRRIIDDERLKQEKIALI